MFVRLVKARSVSVSFASEIKESGEDEEEDTPLSTPSTNAAKHSARNSLAASLEEAFDLSSWHNNNRACRVKRVHLFITPPQMHDVAAGECAAAGTPPLHPLMPFSTLNPATFPSCNGLPLPALRNYPSHHRPLYFPCYKAHLIIGRNHNIYNLLVKNLHISVIFRALASLSLCKDTLGSDRNVE